MCATSQSRSARKPSGARPVHPISDLQIEYRYLAWHRGEYSADLPRTRHRHHSLWCALARPDQRPLVGGARRRSWLSRPEPALPGQQPRHQPGVVDQLRSVADNGACGRWVPGWPRRGPTRAAGRRTAAGPAVRGPGCLELNRLGHTRRVGARCATRRGGERRYPARSSPTWTARRGGAHQAQCRPFNANGRGGLASAKPMFRAARQLDAGSRHASGIRPAWTAVRAPATAGSLLDFRKILCGRL
jgi:hypothetical protein